MTFKGEFDLPVCVEQQPRKTKIAVNQSGSLKSHKIKKKFTQQPLFVVCNGQVLSVFYFIFE
jgi:hypothetical protein